MTYTICIFFLAGWCLNQYSTSVLTPDIAVLFAVLYVYGYQKCIFS